MQDKLKYINFLLIFLLHYCSEGKELGDVVIDEGNNKECSSNIECSDGLICNGEERCEMGKCVPGPPPDCNDNDPCTIDYCSEEVGDCIHDLMDFDEDGYVDVSCGGTDCNDSNGEINPGAIEKCNFIDDDCDGEIYDDLYSLGREIALSDDSIDTLTKGITFTGSEYGVVWVSAGNTITSDDGLYFARISSEGIKLGERRRIVDRYPFYPVITYNGNGYGIVWSDFRDLDWEIYFCRLSIDGEKMGNDSRITLSPGESVYSSIAFSGSEYGIAWEDARNTYKAVYFARISAEGQKVEEESQISEETVNSRFPVIVFTGSEYGVSYSSMVSEGEYEIRFTRISTEGIEIMPSKIIAGARGITFPQTQLTWAGSEFGIIWHDIRRGPDYEIYLARVSIEGEKIGEEVQVTQTETNSFDPSVTFANGVYAISWEQSLIDGTIQIFFNRISTDGIVMGENLNLTSSTGECRFPVLIFTGNEYAISWVDNSDGDYDVFFKRVGCI